MNKLWILGLVLLTVFVSGCIEGTAQIVCKDVEKTKTVNEDRCDYTEGCVCLHKSLFGLGDCDTCRCTYTERVC
jgi:hypothetical protein